MLFPFWMPTVWKSSRVNQDWVWMGSGLQQVCCLTSELRLTVESLAPPGNSRGHKPVPIHIHHTEGMAIGAVSQVWGHFSHPTPATQPTDSTGHQCLSVSAFPNGWFTLSKLLTYLDSLSLFVIFIITAYSHNYNTLLNGKDIVLIKSALQLKRWLSL